MTGFEFNWDGIIQLGGGFGEGDHEVAYLRSGRRYRAPRSRYNVVSKDGEVPFDIVALYAATIALAANCAVSFDVEGRMYRVLAIWADNAGLLNQEWSEAVLTWFKVVAYSDELSTDSKLLVGSMVRMAILVAGNTAAADGATDDTLLQ